MSEPTSKPRSYLTIILAVGIIIAFVGGYYFGTSTVEPQLVYINDAKDVIQKQPVKISADDDPFFGNPNAPITIIEFSDFQCPFCARFHAETQGLIEKNYIESGKVKIVYRDFPLNSHKNAPMAAVAAECANEQGKFWQYHDALFNAQSDWAKLEPIDALETFKQYATQLELSQDFATCLETGRYLQEIQKDLKDGVSYGVSGTPAFFIGNDKIGYTQIDGAKPYDAFSSVIDKMITE